MVGPDRHEVAGNDGLQQDELQVGRAHSSEERLRPTQGCDPCNQRSRSRGNQGTEHHRAGRDHGHGEAEAKDQRGQEVVRRVDTHQGQSCDLVGALHRPQPGRGTRRHPRREEEPDHQGRQHGNQDLAHTDDDLVLERTLERTVAQREVGRQEAEHGGS